ncbi:MAG: hypothetical protein NXI23_16285 [Bacteroidetes bacterium]|jgi:hypothetical protein|nr:hypothetical protein [Bacteroidota bacterium]
MSLDTVLKIGRTFKNAENNYQYLSYLYNPKDTYRNIFRVSLPLNVDFGFEWNNLSVLSDEKSFDKLYELRFKTSGSDSTIKYLYGDIFYEQITGLDKKGKLKSTEERGRIRLQKGDTFKAAQKNVDEIIDEERDNFIEDFMKESESQLIEQLETTKDNYDKKLKLGLIALLKKGMKNYEPEKEIKISKKYEKIECLIYDCLNAAKNHLNQMSLVRFRKSFSENQSQIYTLLKYSNAFEEYLSNPHLYDFQPIELLNNESKLQELAANYALNNSKDTDLEKIFGKDYKERGIPLEERLQLTNFTNHAIFIHFIYPNGKMWYEFEDTWDLIFEKLVNSTFSNQDGKYVLDKSIYRTLASGDKKNDIQFPAFKSETKYKSQYFDNAQVADLLYGLNAYQSKAQQLRGTDIILTLLPKGRNLSAEDYNNFIKRRVNTEKLDEFNQNARDEGEPLFISFFKEQEEQITSFDLLLVNTSGNTNKDLIEISGVKKSTLDFIKNRINGIANQILEKKQNLFPNTFKPKIEYAFQNILGSPQADKKGKISFKANARYEAHLLKVLPQIYCMNYFQDRIILPFFIEKVEFVTRSGSENEPFFKFQNLKYDFEFLLTIQNSPNNKFMEIVNSDSYKIGLLLGRLAKDVSLKINSFEKNYVGNLTRRIGRLDDFIRLKNDILQKLINHVDTKFIYQTSYELDQLIKSFDASKYHKDLVAFGFFESYFKPFQSKN